MLDKMPELETFSSSLLRQWTGACSFKAGRWTVTATDVAQFFALMLCIKPRPTMRCRFAAIAVGVLFENRFEQVVVEFRGECRSFRDDDEALRYVCGVKCI